ncbi:ABC transporter permease [Psychrobacter sp. FDAARGOS_221]|uniref:ABC transporter permease n=1 Tax=Psychrobacter sp. FDAARGOS_221 TaxID=1975705 RepID=UPI000BB56DD8|nr:ABC transporter permease [Psychrobacter sp. FDAARGOS_221]PNK60106.1 ABC transporter permease [Psychrobacter sp. FDAARGOS_221]
MSDLPNKDKKYSNDPHPSSKSNITHARFFDGFLGTLASIFKDKGVLLMLVIAPIIYGFFYPWPYRSEVVKEIPVGVVDYDRSELSKTITRYSDASPNLSVQPYASEQQALNAMYQDEIAGYLIIPSHLESDVYANKPAHVSVLGNNSYFLLNKQIQMGFTTAIGTVSAGVEIKRDVAKGAYFNNAEAGTQSVPLRIDPLFNRSEGYGAYVVPAVAILILQQTLLMGTALLIGTWYEKKQQNATILGWLGRILALGTVTFGMACFYYGWVFSFQNYPRGHNMLGSLLFMALYTPTVATLGCFLGMWFKERERSMQILIFSSLPMFFLSGYPWPVTQLPEPLQYVRWIFPSTSGMNASVQLNQMGASLTNVSSYIIHILALWAIAFILLNWIQYRQIKRQYHGR